MKTFKTFIEEGAMIDNAYTVIHKHNKTGEVKKTTVRASSPKEARNQVENHYTHDSWNWTHKGTHKVD